MFRLTSTVLILFTAVVWTAGCTKKTTATSYGAPMPAGRKVVTQAARGNVLHGKPVRSAGLETMERQARNAMDAGEGDPIVQALRLRVAHEPANLDARLKLAEHYRSVGYPDLAAEHLRLAAERFRDRGDVQVNLARALRDVDASESGVTVLRTFLASHESAEASSALGVMEDDLGRTAEAEAAHRRAVELQPKRASYLNNLGYNLLLQGKHSEAAGELRKAVAIEPRNETARNNLAASLAVSDPKEALAHWRSMNDPATAHSNLAAVLMEQGKFEDARVQLSAALGYQRDHPLALRNLATLAEMDGRPPEVPVIVKQDRSLRTLALRVRQMFRKTGSGTTDASRTSESALAASR